MGVQGFFIEENGMKSSLRMSWVILGLVTGRGLNAAAEPINLAKVAGDADVLLVADDHTQAEIKTFLADHLQELRGLGFSSLGIEMLPSHFQSDLDRSE